MSLRPVPHSRPLASRESLELPEPSRTIGVQKGFQALAGVMLRQPLHEMGAATPGDEPAALGFALGLAASWAGAAGIFLVGEDNAFTEIGAPYPPGLAALGLNLTQLIFIRAGKRDDAMWATEQALSAPGAIVLCALGAQGKPLDLKATRRLLLFAERTGARCLLLRPLAETSAAWTRWRVASAPSVAEAREVGAPAFSLELVRSRSGPAGARFIVEWDANERAFAERAGDDLGCAVSTAPADRSADPRWARG